MDNNAFALYSGFLFGAIGAGYVVYGRKAEKPMFLVSGLSLWAFTAMIFFATWIFLGLSIAAFVLPFIWRP